MIEIVGRGKKTSLSVMSFRARLSVNLQVRLTWAKARDKARRRGCVGDEVV